MARFAMSRVIRRTLVVGALASATVVAVQTPSTASIGGVAQWKAVPVCHRAHGAHMSCFAWRLVRTDKSSLGTVAAARQRLGLSKPDAVTFGPAGGYTPADLAKAYGVDVNASAASSMTVAIVDAFGDPNIATDLATFDAQYGIPAETATSFKVVNQSGAASPLPGGNSWSTEQALDVQSVRGLCHKCKIVLIQATSNSFANLNAAENTAANVIHADIISNSFGGPELPAQNSAFSDAFNHPKIAVVASTGDDGWYDWDVFNNQTNNTPPGAANVPNGLNTVVAVGGTSLYLNPDGTRNLERVWNDNGPFDFYADQAGFSMGAAGSGCSQLYNPRPWQKSVAGYPSLGCNGKRSSADIAAIADPFTGYDIIDSVGIGDWATIGGTSLAAPVVSALWALAGGPGGVKYPSLTLYGHFKSAPSTYDVTIGGTGACDTASTTACAGYFGKNPNEQIGALVDCAFPATGTGTIANRGQCYAGPGFDGPSGVGSPKGIKEFLPMKPTASIANPGTVTHGQSTTFNGSGSSDPFPGGTISKYSWDFGDGQTGTGKTRAHSFAAKGTFTVTLTVTDNYGVKGKITRSVAVK
jgi:subtilase family serine protease